MDVLLQYRGLNTATARAHLKVGVGGCLCPLQRAENRTNYNNVQQIISLMRINTCEMLLRFGTQYLDVQMSAVPVPAVTGTLHAHYLIGDQELKLSHSMCLA